MYNIITELFSKLGNLSFITLLLCILILATIIMCAYVFLHLFSFKTPPLGADLSKEGDADCALEMRNGV